jgi:hypothetical protein
METNDDDHLSLRDAMIERIKETLSLPLEALPMFEGMPLVELGLFERFALNLKVYFEKTSGFWVSNLLLKSQPKETVRRFHLLALSWTPLLKAVHLRNEKHACADKSGKDLEYEIAPEIIRKNPAVSVVYTRPHEDVLDAIVASKHVKVVVILSSPGCLQGNLSNLARSQVKKFTFCGDLELGAFFEAVVQTGTARDLVLTDWKTSDPTLASEQVARLIRVGKLKSIALFPHCIEAIALALKSNTLIESVKWNHRNVAPFCKVLMSNRSIGHVDLGRCSWSDISPYISEWRGVLHLAFTQCEFFNRPSLYSFGEALCLNQSLTKLTIRRGPENLQACFIPSTYMGVFLRTALTGNGTLTTVNYDKKIISEHKDVSKRNLRGVRFSTREDAERAVVSRGMPGGVQANVMVQHGSIRKGLRVSKDFSLDRLLRNIALNFYASPLRLSLSTSNGIRLSFSSPLNHTKTIADLGPNPAIYLSTGDRASVVFCWLALRSLISSEPEPEPESEPSKGKRRGSLLNSDREVKRSRRLGFNLADLPFELIEVIVKHMGPPAKDVLFN